MAFQTHTFWSDSIDPGHFLEYVPPLNYVLHLSMVCIGAPYSSDNSRDPVKSEFSIVTAGKACTICHLNSNTALSMNLNFCFPQQIPITFRNNGNGRITISGYLKLTYVSSTADKKLLEKNRARNEKKISENLKKMVNKEKDYTKIPNRPLNNSYTNGISRFQNPNNSSEYRDNPATLKPKVKEKEDEILAIPLSSERCTNNSDVVGMDSKTVSGKGGAEDYIFNIKLPQADNNGDERWASEQEYDYESEDEHSDPTPEEIYYNRNSLNPDKSVDKNTESKVKYKQSEKELKIQTGDGFTRKKKLKSVEDETKSTKKGQKSIKEGIKKTHKESKRKLTKAKKEAKEKAKKEKVVWKTNKKVRYFDFVEGTGKVLKKGDYVRILYAAKDSDGNIIDSAVNPEKPFSFKYGVQEVMKGWDIGMSGMRYGGKRKIIIPEKLTKNSGERNFQRGPLAFTVKVLDKA